MSSNTNTDMHDSNAKNYIFMEEKNSNASTTHRTDATSNSMQINNNATDKTQELKKKITIVVDEDDPCLKEGDKQEEEEDTFHVPGVDPRFQQQNQTLRCWVMYTDFYRCEHILGTGANACTWFKQAFTSICPMDWVRRWDTLRVEGKFPWHKYKTQGKFPGYKYGV